MTRGLVVSVGLHVAVFAAAILGPRPKPFEWDPQTPHVVELVSRTTPPPVDRPVVPREEPAPRPKVEPPVSEPVQEVKPVEPEPEVTKTPEPAPVRPKPKPSPPPRKFQRVAPRKPDEGPSLAERLQQRLDDVASPAEEASAPPPEEGAAAEPADPATEDAAVVKADAADFPFAWYLRQVQTRVRDAWDTPGQQLLPGRARPVAVAFVIHRDGRVSEVRIVDGSGSPGLDASALRAVEAARPFPPLPEPYGEDRLELTIRFHVAGGNG